MKTNDRRCTGQSAFCSLDNVRSSLNIVLLKRSHWALPLGLYGHVSDCCTPYNLRSDRITSLSKDFPWSLCILDGIPYTWNHFSTRAFATVSAFWFGVTTATENLEKASVITNTFSLPVFDGSIFVKSRHKRSRGLLDSQLPNFRFRICVGPLSHLTACAMRHPLGCIVGHRGPVDPLPEKF